ncbi:MAG TPA: hypothetical protein VNO51_04540, partial [Ilumatobacteraceae bacterium]|nr:hypothetical protein [Ilumatobacteraceae bacterium]
MLSVEWVGDGIRYRVNVDDDLDQALEFANAITGRDDAAWHDILDIARTNGTATEPPAIQQRTSFLADQLDEAGTDTTLDTAIDDARIAVTVTGIADYQFLITRYRAVSVEGDRPAPDTTISEGDVYVDPNTITVLSHNGDVIRVTCISATATAARHCDDGDGQPNHLNAMVDLAVTTAHLPTATAPGTRYDNTQLVFNSLPTLDDFATEHGYGSFHLCDYNGLPDSNPPPTLTPILIPPTD